MKIGANDIADLKIGTTEINEVRLGSVLVWERNSYLLDLYPATAAYSLRKLRSAYTGAAIRVRRSLDNTEQDIGFLADELDIASLLSFAGVGDGFVSVWYDQSGAGLNLTQTTASNQPRIVNTGIIELENGKPSLNWYGTTQFLNGGNVLGLNGNSLQIYCLARNTLTTNRVQLVSKSVAAANVNRYNLATGGALGTSTGINTSSTEYFAPSNFAHANQNLFNSVYLTNNEIRAFVNNTSVASASAPSGTVQNIDTRFLIGATNNATNNGQIAYHRGTMQEIILYIASTTSLPDLSNINTIINEHYNVY